MVGGLDRARAIRDGAPIYVNSLRGEEVHVTNDIYLNVCEDWDWCLATINLITGRSMV